MINVPEPLEVFYKNWKGVTRLRTIIPISLDYKATDYHNLQWMLRCIDTEKNEIREFALVDCDFTRE